jgi:hypothetical protein
VALLYIGGDGLLNGVLQVGGWFRGVDHFVWLSCIMNV